MRKLSISVLVSAAFLAVGVARAEESQDASHEEIKAASAKVTNPALKDHLLRNIDIFGKTDLPAIYILMPGITGEEEIRGSLLTRDFSRDPFFMQNIDREEFEMKTSLREFTDEEQVAGNKKDEPLLR